MDNPQFLNTNMNEGMSHLHGGGYPGEHVYPPQTELGFFHQAPPGPLPGPLPGPPFVPPQLGTHTVGLIHPHVPRPFMNVQFASQPQFFHPQFGPYFGPQPVNFQPSGLPVFAPLSPQFQKGQSGPYQIGPPQHGPVSFDPEFLVTSPLTHAPPLPYAPPRLLNSPLPDAPPHLLHSRLPLAPSPNARDGALPFGSESSPPISSSSNPFSNAGTEQASLAPGTEIDTDDIFKTTTRPCHIAHRKYVRWMGVVYNSSMPPHTFVQEWRRALTEVRLAFGFSCIPDIIVFNQFLAAVSTNPATREWIDSLHVTMDKTSAASVMGETYSDFLRYESRRLGLPRSTWDIKNGKRNGPHHKGALKHFCPYHGYLTTHLKEECYLSPTNERSETKN